VLYREMSKTKAAFLVSLSGLAAVISALELHGWPCVLGTSSHWHRTDYRICPLVAEKLND
jgi:hypothetical protein